ncbi:hypothetical protein [Rhodococcus sp. SORGH_AS_0303]|uniref:hypothetical protein n=1 Tax=Rhodococcus sp. SORGH_AS_0303 TaxID=3041753 RepID=UPI00278367FA|nr:hypothetical protein [Rhodococcus sp. SORGH_AS_0303]MDQ1202854.1 hypothetical protein [Rhodococcus sp. SORGH_AS_0303]
MSRFIDRTMVTLQVETASQDVWVPDGLAVARRNYDPSGIKMVPGNGLAFEKDVTIVTTSSLMTVRANKAKIATPVTEVDQNSSGDVRTYKSRSLGPVVFQNRVAVPVRPGMRVNMKGTLSLRRTGKPIRDQNESYTPIALRFDLWGTGTTVDEYGTETDVKKQIMSYQATLQGTAGVGVGFVDFTLPTVSDATVPSDVDRLYLTASFVATNTNSYQGVGYQARYWFAEYPDYIQFDLNDPLTIFVREPANTTPTVANSNSRTGFAYRNRRFYTNLPSDTEIVLVGDPNATAVATISVWAWTGTERAGWLTGVDVAPNQRVSVIVNSPTRGIELSTSAPAILVESVTARPFETRTAERTRTTAYTYADVIDPVVSIESETVEADLGVLTVRFVSDTINAKVSAGKRVRLLATHADGSFEPIFTGTIRGRRIVHDFKHQAQVQISVHDAFGRAGQSTMPVAHDRLAEYGHLVHTTGVPIIIDGTDYSGPPRSLPEGWDYFPSYADDAMTMNDALIKTRNARKAFLYVDRRDRMIVTSTLPTTVTLDLSDKPGQGDMSYNRDIEFSSDTENLVNTVQVVEHMLDRKEFIEREVGGADPPALLGDLAPKTQRIDYRRQASIDTYGQHRVSIDVIRGSGSWADVQADRFGAPFAEWAAAILDEYSVERQAVNRLRLTATKPIHRTLMAKLQPLDAVVVRFGNSAQVCRIRKVEHKIAPNKWTVDLSFGASRDQTYWLPPTPLPVLTLGDTDAGTQSYPSPGLIDGGAPGDTVTAVLDGGTL